MLKTVLDNQPMGTGRGSSQANYTKELDPQSETYLAELSQLQEQIKANRVPGVRTVMVVTSSRGMVFDFESLRQKILLAYPEAAVFFRTTLGKAWGAPSPAKVDLLIDFTGPGQRQGIFYSRRLRAMARHAVGRNAGFFRKRIYDRVFDEKAIMSQLPVDLLSRERVVQREVLELAGVAMSPMGDVPPDRGKSIALELPSLART